MLVYKGIKLRIYPNKEQQDKILCNFGYNRFVWNQMLDMIIKRYENNPKSKFLNAFALNYLLPELKCDNPFLKEAESTSLQVTNKSLIDAYKRFFKFHKGFPKFKSRKYPKQSYTSGQRGKSIRIINNHHINLPKLGTVKYQGAKSIEGKIKNVTIRLSATNKYYAILLVEQEVKPFNKTGNKLGIDMGVADLAITSSGVKYPTVRFDKILAQKKHYWEKRLARRRLQADYFIAQDKHNKALVPRTLADFKNYQKAKLMVAKYSEKVANQRKGYLHNITTQLVKDNDVIVMEDLKAKNLLKNHKLARAIANQGWREFRMMLEYKCQWYGKNFIAINPYKTSQICSTCGHDDGKHTLDIRDWVCPQCHTHHDRDINAAKNILHLGLEQALVK